MFTSNKLNSKDSGKKKILIGSGDQIIKIVFGNSKTKNDNLEKNIYEIGLEEEKSDEIYGNQAMINMFNEYEEKAKKKDEEYQNFLRNKEKKERKKIEEQGMLNLVNFLDDFGGEEEKKRREEEEKELVVEQEKDEEEDDEDYEDYGEDDDEAEGEEEIEDDEKEREEEGKLEKFGHFVGNAATTIKGEIEKTPESPERLRKVDEVKENPSKLKKGVKNEITSKKKAFNSMFGLTGLRFKIDGEEDNQDKFESPEEFLAWNFAQNVAKGLNDKIKSLITKIGNKFSFLKFYKENYDEIDNILNRRPVNDEFNGKKIEFFTYWDIEKLDGKNLNEYINKAQNHIENLKSYSKELNEISKKYGIPMPDSDSKRSSFNDDDDEFLSSDPLTTILIATGYFIREVIDKTLSVTNENNGEKSKKSNKSRATIKQKSNSNIDDLNGFWGTHYQFKGGDKEITLGKNWEDKIVKENATIEHFNKETKKIIKKALDLAGNDNSKGKNIRKFFEKISSKELKKDDINEYENDIKLLENYMKEREQGQQYL